MTALDIFTYSGQQVRRVMVDGEARIVVADIARILGYRDAANAARVLREQHKGYSNVSTPSGEQRMLTTNAAGFNRLILRSNASNAEAVQDWVTDTVLISIAETGSYSTTPALTEDQIVHQALSILVAKTTALEAQISLNAPKVIFADAVATSASTILVGELAKILRGNGVELGQNRLFELLREDGYLIKRRGSDRNMPTQYSMELGLFEIKETAISHSDGHVTVSKTPKVTGKGQAYFVNRYAPSVGLAVAS